MQSLHIATAFIKFLFKLIKKLTVPLTSLVLLLNMSSAGMAETTVSAAAGIISHNDSPTVSKDNFFINLNIYLLKINLEFLYLKYFLKLMIVRKNRYASSAYSNSLFQVFKLKKGC